MINRMSARRYAQVLFNIDVSKKMLHKRLGEFDFIREVLRTHPNLSKFLEAPHIPLENKQDVLSQLVKGNVDSSFGYFLEYLLRKRKLSYLDCIAKEYRLLVDEHEGVWEANIITAVPIEDGCETKLEEKLARHFHKKVKLNKTVDPAIIGGAVLLIANTMLDWSVAGRLRKLKDNLIQTQV